MPFGSQPSGKGLPLGLTGATAATRYVGATASGAPASGTFAVGDFIIDQSGKVYVCTTAGTPGTWTQVGGAAAPTSRQNLDGNNVNINGSGSGVLTWDTSYGPSVLLDRSSLTAPTIVTAGVYAIGLNVRSTALTAGTFLRVTFELDANGEDASYVAGAISVAGETQPYVLLTPTYYLAAGAVLKVTVNNGDGINPDRDFRIQNAWVLRIS